jgi:hypothetical protein
MWYPVPDFVSARESAASKLLRKEHKVSHITWFTDWIGFLGKEAQRQKGIFSVVSCNWSEWSLILACEKRVSTGLNEVNTQIRHTHMADRSVAQSGLRRSSSLNDTGWRTRQGFSSRCAYQLTRAGSHGVAERCLISSTCLGLISANNKLLVDTHVDTCEFWSKRFKQNNTGRHLWT